MGIHYNDTGVVELYRCFHADDSLELGDEGTVLAGTILARKANGKLAVFAPAADDGTEVPVAVLPYEVEFDAAGAKYVRPIVGGTVRAERLVIHEDGDGSNVTPAVLDKLRATSIVPVSVAELAKYDTPDSV